MISDFKASLVYRSEFLDRTSIATQINPVSTTRAVGLWGTERGGGGGRVGGGWLGVVGHPFWGGGGGQERLGLKGLGEYPQE